MSINPKVENAQTIQSRDKRTREVAQLSILYYILNKDFAFIFNKPKKKTTVNSQLPELVEIDFGIDKMDINDFLEKRTEGDSVEFSKKLTQRQVARKVETLKRIYINNYLMDLAMHKGVIFESKSTKKDIEQMEWFMKIRFDGNTLTSKDILTKGIEISKLLTECVGEGKFVTIEKGQLRELYKI